MKQFEQHRLSTTAYQWVKGGGNPWIDLSQTSPKPEVPTPDKKPTNTAQADGSPWIN